MQMRMVVMAAFIGVVVAELPRTSLLLASDGSVSQHHDILRNPAPAGSQDALSDSCGADHEPMLRLQQGQSRSAEDLAARIPLVSRSRCGRRVLASREGRPTALRSRGPKARS